MIKELILKNRSYRRFYEEEKIPTEILKGFIDLARLSPSARNLQPLKYFISNDVETNNKIFPNLAWAGYLKDWDGPTVGERPSAYIIILGDKEISNNFGIDPGICAQSILLGAVEKGFGGCIIGSVNKERVKEVLNIHERFEILYVIALGKPKEIIVLEDVVDEKEIKYWRDDKKVHHVPKRKLNSLIINNK